MNTGTWIPFLNLKDPAVAAELEKSGLTKGLLEREAEGMYDTVLRAVKIVDDGSEPTIISLDG